MKALLDTHMVLWFFEDDPRLPEKAKQIILDDTCDKYVSMASLWEIAIKMNLNKFSFAGGFSAFVEMIRENGCSADGERSF